MTENQGVSFRPSDQVEGGGLLDDAVVTWTSARFVMWDYNGKAPMSPALKVEMKTEDGVDHIQYWSAGNSKDWSPSSDGKRLLKTGDAKGINSNSNLGLLINSVVNAGYDESKMSDDISQFDGMKCHMIQVAAPKRSGLSQQPRADGKVYEPTILIVDQIELMPGEKAAAKPAAGKAATGGGGGGDDAVRDKATEVIMGILMESGPTARKSLPQLVFKAMADDDPLRGDVSKLAFNEEFLKSEGVPWNYANGELSM
jgi:hypothetical protein